MTEREDPRLQLIRDVESRFGQLRDLCLHFPATEARFHVLRLSAFDHMLSLEELTTLVDEADHTEVVRRRAAFQSFFAQAFAQSTGYFLATHWLRRPSEGMRNSNEEKRGLSRKLVGPLSNLCERSRRTLEILSVQLTERSGGLVLFDAIPCLIRGHDDFGCLIVCNDPTFIPQLAKLSLESGLFLLRPAEADGHVC